MKSKKHLYKIADIVKRDEKMATPGTFQNSSETTPHSEETSKGYTSPRIFRQALGMAMEETSIHGLSHIWNNRHNFLVIFWVLIFSGSLLGLIWTSASILKGFFDRQVYSQTELRLSTELPLPSIAICNKVFFSKRKLEELNIDSKTYAAMMAMASAPVGMNFKKFRDPSTRAELETADESIQEILNSLHLTFEKLVQRVSYSCEELVLGCSVNQNFSSGAECCSQMVAMPTMSGLCHTFYTRKDFQRFIGEAYGLTLYIRVPQDDTPEIIPDFLDMTSVLKRGIQVTPISRTAHPSWLVSGNGVLVQPSTITSLELSAVEKNREKEKVSFLDQDIEPCLNEDEASYTNNKTMFMRTYTNCYYWLFSECSSKFCKCSFYGSDSSDGSTFCNMQETVKCFEKIGTSEDPQVANDTHQFFQSCLVEAKPRCRTICRELTFKYSATHTNYTHLHIHEELTVNNHDERPAVVNIYYGNFDYTHIKFWREEFSVLLSNQGGQMGLFLGCSLISVLEFIMFSILIAIACLRSLVGKIGRQYSRLNSEDVKEDERTKLVDHNTENHETEFGYAY